MTNDHLLELTLAAPPADVFAALASPAGVRRWWTAGADGPAGVGEVMRVTFRPGHWTELRVDALVPNQTVRWTCVAQQEPGFDRPDEWVGTAMEFALAPGEGATTTLRFAHRGLEALECRDLCRRGWSFYLGQSLAALCATGEGRPDTPRDDRPVTAGTDGARTP